MCICWVIGALSILWWHFASVALVRGERQVRDDASRLGRNGAPADSVACGSAALLRGAVSSVTAQDGKGTKDASARRLVKLNLDSLGIKNTESDEEEKGTDQRPKPPATKKRPAKELAAGEPEVV